MNWAWPPSRWAATTIRRATWLAIAAPWSLRTRCRQRSMPAAVPADVSTAAAVHVELVGHHLHPRVAAREQLRVAPVRGRALPVEQPGGGQHEGAGADRHEPRAARVGRAQRGHQLAARDRRARRASRAARSCRPAAAPRGRAPRPGRSRPGRAARRAARRRPRTSTSSSVSSSGRGSAKTSAATPSSNGARPSWASTVTRWLMSESYRQVSFRTVAVADRRAAT